MRILIFNKKFLIFMCIIFFIIFSMYFYYHNPFSMAVELSINNGLDDNAKEKLMTGMFVTYVYQRAENLNQNDEHFASVCQMVALITVGVLLVGVLNVPLSPLEKGLFPLAFIVCLLGQVLLMRSAEYLSKGPEL